MTIASLSDILGQYPEKLPRFILPTGQMIPAHFHVTEVGHVAKNFIDCGGTVRKSDACVLQTWVNDGDLDHRLTNERFAKILQLGARVLPSDDLPVEVEYEDEAISQYPLKETRVAGEYLDLLLTTKHTDCLAKERCGINEESCCSEPTETACC